jgi:hypothetical protein
VNFIRPAISEEIFHLVRTMETPAVPNHQQLATEMTGRMTKAKKMAPFSNNPDDSATSLYARVDCFRQL